MDRAKQLGGPPPIELQYNGSYISDGINRSGGVDIVDSYKA